MNRSASVCRIKGRDKISRVNRDKVNSQVNNKHATVSKDSNQVSNRDNKVKVNNRDNSKDSKISVVNKDNNRVKDRDNSKPAIINKGNKDSREKDSKVRDNRDKGNNQGSKVKVNKVRVSRDNKDRGKVRDSNKVSVVRGKGSKTVVRTEVAVSVKADNTTRTECPEAVGCHPAENARPAQKSANECVKHKTYASN